MTSLQTLTVTLEIENDGEFTTKIKSADGSLESLGKSAQNAIKQVNAISTSFSRVSRTLSTLTDKFSTSATNAGKLTDTLDRLEAAAERANGMVASLSLGISNLTAASRKGVTQLKKLGDSTKDFAKNTRTIAQNAGKGADGIKRLGTAAKNSASQINDFSIASAGVGNSFSKWGKSSEASGEAIDKLGGKMATATIEARNLREALGAVQRTRGGRAANNLTEKATSGMREQPRTAAGGGGVFDGESRSARTYGAEIDNVTKKLSQSGNAHESFVGKLTRTAFAIDEVTYAASIMWDTFGGGVEKIIEVNAHTEKLITTLKGLSTLQTDQARNNEAVDQYNQLFQIAQRSPFSLDKLADGFVKLKTANLANPIAALKSTSDALAHFSASEQQFKSAMIAIMQMSGKGVVSMEELRRQLGEAMPTAMQNLATAMEVTEGRLVKLVSSGSLQSRAAIQLLMDEFDRMYGGSSEQKMKTFSGQMALFSTNMQKLALGAGGRGMDGEYGPNSFYTQVTRGIEALNKMLESPEAMQAARNLNDMLTSVTRSLTTLIPEIVSFGASWGGTILHITEFVVAIKSANLAVSGLLRVMAAMEGSKFLQNSGILGAITSIGSREIPTVTRGPMGEAIRGTERTAGAFGSTKNFLGSIAEQGVWTAVSAKAGDAIGKINTYWQTTLKASAAGTGLSSSLLKIVGGFATVATVAVPVALAIGGITLAWVALDAAMNRVTNTTNIVGKALQNMAQGDTSKDTMKVAQAEYDKIARRREDMQRVVDQMNNAQQGQTFDARQFGSVNGVGSVSGGRHLNWFQRLVGDSDDQWLAKGTAAAEEYKIRAQQALAAVKAEQEQAKRILDNAPTIKRDQDARDIESTTLADTNILMRTPEADYAAKMSGINIDRAALSNGTSDAAKNMLGQLSDQQAKIVAEENQQHINILKNQIASQVRLANLDKQAGNTDAFLTRSKAIELLNGDLKNLQEQLDGALARLGKFDQNTAVKAMDREIKNANNWMAAAQNKINTENESRGDNIPGASNVEQVKAWESAFGKFANLGDTLKSNMLSIAEELDRVTASTKNWDEAMKSVKATQDEINKASQEFNAAYIQSQITDSPLGKDYSTRIAQINQNENKGLRDLDIYSSDLDSHKYESVTEAIRQTDSAYNDLQDTLNGFTTGSQESGVATQGMTNDVNIMSQTVNDASGDVNSMSSALSAYALQAASAGKASEDLADKMNLINASDIARKIVGVSAALRKANADIESARRQKEAAESPAMRRKDRQEDVNNSYTAETSQIAAVLGDQSKGIPRDDNAIAAMAKNNNISFAEQVNQLQAGMERINQAREASLGAIDSQYSKSMSHSGGTRSNPVNTLRENIAKLTAELNGGDGAMAKFGQRMQDMKKPIDATTRSLMQQDAALRKQVEAQNRALKNAEYFIQNSAQSHDEATASIATLGFGDPSSVSASLAKIKAEYDSIIADVNKNVQNPEAKADAIQKLQAGAAGSYDNAIASKLQEFNQQSFSDDSYDAYSLPDKRAEQEGQLLSKVQAVNEAIANSTDFTEAQKRQAYETTARYVESQMQRLQRENEGTLTQSGRQWSDWNKGIQDGVNSSMSDIMSSMSDALEGGTTSWKSFGESVLKIFSDLAMKLAMSPIMTLMGKFMDGASGNSGGWANSLVNLFGMGAKTGGGIASDLSGVTAAVKPVSMVSLPAHHMGGLVGSEPTFFKSIPSSVLARANKYHTGGLAGDEVPAILQRGEGVFTKGQMAAIGSALSNVQSENLGMSSAMLSMAATRTSQAFDAKAADNAVDNIGKSPKGSANVKINMNNQTGQGMKMNTSQPKWDGESWVIDTVIKHAQRPGNLRTTLKSAQ